MSKETAAERQSRVSKTGRKWEDYVQDYVSNKLKGKGITILRGDVVPENSFLWKKLAIPTKVSTIKESVWGDIDLVAMKGDVVIAVISCKLSLHGRFTETLFYSLLFRMLSRTKFVLATPDAGRGQKSQIWKSEWGKPEEPTKDRTLAESYIDGVYVENVDEFCPGKKPDEFTCLGGIVRSLSELPQDIVRWGEENSKFTFTTKDSKIF
jgi:hypothetical protein